MHSKLSFLVDLVKPDGLLQLALGTDGARVPLFVHPLDGEGVGSRESANFSHLRLQVIVLNRVIDVSDEDLPATTKKSLKI